MSMTGRIARALGVLAVVAIVTGCAAVTRYHGFVPTDRDLEEIVVGLDTRTTVEAIIGKPGADSLLQEGAWYYVRSEFEHNSFHAPEEINREVVAISFDEDGVVTNVERFGLERGEVVVLNRRVTDSNIQQSFLRQLFGGITGASGFQNLFGK